MANRRRLIVVLAAFLVINGLVAVLPHEHGPAKSGQNWRTPLSIDATHHCLACSVHSPDLEPAAEFGHPARSVSMSPVVVKPGSRDVLPVPRSAGPRGPPLFA
jgi:hypothetical protein